MQIVRHNCWNKVTVRLWGRFLLLHNTKRNWEWHQFFRFQQFHPQDRNFASLDTQRTNPPQRLAKSLGRVKTSRTSRKQRTWEGRFWFVGWEALSNVNPIGQISDRVNRGGLFASEEWRHSKDTTGHRRASISPPPPLTTTNKSVGTV